MIEANDASAGTAAVAVLRRLPGAARPRAEALREYEEFNARRRKRIPAVLWPFWAPDPDQFYRWRVQLDCGCIREVMTTDKTQLPTEQQWRDLVHGPRLPVGQLICAHDEKAYGPYQRIVEWGRRREESFPPDPQEPPEWAEPELWAKIRRDEPSTSAFWTVTLSCGHATDVVTDVDWKPDDGPQRVSEQRRREMLAEIHAMEACEGDVDDADRAHFRRMVDDGWPRPQPEQRCWSCPRARRIVAYQRVGWLVPRRTPAPPPAPSRTGLEQRLRRAEAEADRLRAQLAQLDGDTDAQQ
jgi:hypothetical protein